ncbi:MAG TPA: prenyltransferase/squalene oxidase repeat-containing protein [Planctomycetota bacterium]|nr:prenyltransferase/squalene oxidase repeat-containing protein [Planctomycetota bacterium]
MILVAAMALALQRAEPWDTVSEALRFLARHQRPDGSWGERPGTCTCPRDEARAAADAASVTRLLRALDADDPIARDTAMQELRGFDETALPHLRAAVKDPDPEIAKVCAALCRRLELATKGAGDVELTALALLAFLGAGYSPLSKDVYDGVPIGPAAQKGLEWLAARQKGTGAFDAKDPVADAVAALATSEAFGLTNRESLKEDAQKGIGRIAAAEMKETRGLVWKGMALKSAEISGLTVARTAAADNFKALAARKDATAEAAYPMISIFHHRNQQDPRLSAIGNLDPDRLGTEDLYFADLGVFQYDGPKGTLWKAWLVRIKERVLPGQVSGKQLCSRGSWDGIGLRGRLRGTALQGLMFEIYYNH